MNATTAAPDSSGPSSSSLPAHASPGRRGASVALALGALGIVFGDIGTSPLFRRLSPRQPDRFEGWSRARALPLLLLFLTFDAPFFVANLFKLFDGGWVPVLIGIVLISAMLIWSKGRNLIVEQYLNRFPSLTDAMPKIRERLIGRVPGTAVFLASSLTRVPPILMHQVDRLRVLHERVVLMTILTEDVAVVPPEKRVEVLAAEDNFFRVVARYGFMEQPNVEEILKVARATTLLPNDAGETTYFLGRETILARATGQMGRIAEGLFSYLQRNAVAADRQFGIPPSQAVEIGAQIDLLAHEIPSPRP